MYPILSGFMTPSPCSAEIEPLSVSLLRACIPHFLDFLIYVGFDHIFNVSGIVFCNHVDMQIT